MPLQDNNYPLYSIGVAADLLEVHPRTLRLYEQAGLLCPSRRGGKRFYSPNDLNWLRCLRRLIHDEGVNIAGLQKLLQFAPCWEIRRRTCREYRCCRTCILCHDEEYHGGR
ncbi:MAG: MerR family transcriptional regulator [Deltaproteobacteria bacterium]|nr:MerR family transcriptional regulator [Candidatus Anaeroferrophillus wilburensis]MBN2889142.1 MerR family transcriptional regulator [Deltaproteobacteria bacterium]